MMKERDLSLKRALKSKQANDKRTFIMLRNKVTKEIRYAKANFFISIISEARGNTKLIWKQIQKLVGSDHLRHSKQLELNINNKLVQDPMEQAKAFNEYFIDSVNKIAQGFPSTCEIATPVDPTLPTFSIDHITCSKVHMIIDSLKHSTAKDIFGMDTAMLKNLKESSNHTDYEPLNL